MSQIAAPQAAPPPRAPRPVGQPAPPAAQPAPQGAGFIDTPALLNRWQLVGSAAVVLFGVLAALIQLASWQADGRAADDTEQLVRVQEIQSSLLRADALATNAFLVGGLEDTAQRREYDAAIASALRAISDAAEAQSADRAALAELNVEVADYATAVGQARANNRQGFPVGAEYMSGASSQLRSEALPVLEALVEANTERAEGAMDAHHPLLLILVGILALATLWSVNRRLAQLFHRHINRGLAIAAVIVAVVTLVTAAAAWLRDSSNESVRESEFAVAVDQADARTAANDAKANESLRLIKRGSGAAFEEQWRASADVVEQSAIGSSLGLWDDYAAQHAEIVRLDEAGKWDEAVALATAPGGPTAAMDAFDQRAQEIVADNGAVATDDLRGGRVLTLLLGFLTLGLGLVAAVAVARGIAERRREYS